MAEPPIPPSLEHLADRPFSFYPAILNIEHNEWLYLRSNWSEVLVVNQKTKAEIWIPRRYVGEISPVEDPVMIVGLNLVLEYKGGTLWPHQKRVLKMPPAPVRANQGASADEPKAPRSILGVRMDASDKRILNLIGGVILGMLVVYILVVNWNRIGDPQQRRVVFTSKDETFLEFNPRSDYFAVVQKLGQPATDRWQSETGALQYRALGYPDRHYTVILMGGDRPGAHYIGVMDDQWVPVHSVEIRSGGDTGSLLRALKRF
jgi:hypothetical protein